MQHVRHRHSLCLARLGEVPAKPAKGGGTPAPSLRTELLRLQQMLQSAGEELVSEQSLSAAYVAALQAMDAVAASLGELAAAVDPGQD